MAETKWTPGEWDWSPAQGVASGKREVILRPAKVFVVSGGTSRDLAEVGLDRIDEANENARLMAAAPQMVDALRAAFWVMEDAFGHAGAPYNQTAHDALNAVRAALAKAEGEQP